MEMSGEHPVCFVPQVELDLSRLAPVQLRSSSESGDEDLPRPIEKRQAKGGSQERQLKRRKLEAMRTEELRA